MIDLFHPTISYREDMLKTDKTDEALLRGLDNYYYNNKDLRLLLDLLSERSGYAASLRVLALFDKELSLKFKPGDLDISFKDFRQRKAEINIWNQEGKITQEENESKTYDINVKFLAAPAMDEIISRIKTITSVTCMYTVEILPPTPRSSVKPVTVDNIMAQDDINDMREEGKGGTEAIKLTTSTSKLLNVVLEGLDTSTEYCICVSTVVNGRSLAQRSERIKPKVQ